MSYWKSTVLDSIRKAIGLVMPLTNGAQTQAMGRGNKGRNEVKDLLNPVADATNKKNKEHTAQQTNAARSPIRPRDVLKENEPLNASKGNEIICDAHEPPRTPERSASKHNGAVQRIASYYRTIDPALSPRKDIHNLLTGVYHKVEILGVQHEIYVQSIEPGKKPQLSEELQLHVQRILDALQRVRGPAVSIEAGDARNRPIFWMLDSNTVVPYETLPLDLLPTTGDIDASISNLHSTNGVNKPSSVYLGSCRPTSALAMLRVGHCSATPVRFSNMGLPRHHGCPTCKAPVAGLDRYRACHRAGHFLACAAHGAATAIAYGCDCPACTPILDRAAAMAANFRACELTEISRRLALEEKVNRTRRKPRWSETATVAEPEGEEA